MMWMKFGAVYQKNARGQDFLYAIMRRHGVRHATGVVLDRNEISPRCRRVGRHGRPAAVLRNARVPTVVKDVAPIGNVEHGVEVAGRDREGVVAGWRRDPHPVEEHAGADLPDFPFLTPYSTLSSAWAVPDANWLQVVLPGVI
jgi:hypothetical protein